MMLTLQCLCNECALRCHGLDSTFRAEPDTITEFHSLAWPSRLCSCNGQVQLVRNHEQYTPLARRGAASGEGLGNAFLSHIQAVDGIFHVCRGFEVRMQSLAVWIRSLSCR